MERYWIIWPERRWLSHKDLLLAYEDAIANDELEEEDRDATTVQDIQRALSSAGIYTFGRSV